MNGTASPHCRDTDKTKDNNGDLGSNCTKSPKPVAHNNIISINVTDTDSPAGVRRRIHLRSLSDVTPASRALAPRARSHSERPRASPAPSPAHHAALAPRAARSERSSPDPSFAPHSPHRALSPRSETRSRPRDVGTVLGNPWRKMSEVDPDSAGGRARPLHSGSVDGGSRPADPWVKNSALRGGGDAARARAASRSELAAPTVDPEPKREGVFKRGKLERRSPVGCEACGNESCECWRPRTPRLTRGAASLGAQCTCEARSPRPSPARPALRAPPAPPAPAAPAFDERPRRLHKSASQKALAAPASEGAPEPADPLLETTC